MGGRRNQGSEEVGRIKAPDRRKGEMFARVVDIYGNDRMRVFCEDGKTRIGRIRGKIKKRVWIRKGDLVVVNPWDWETQTQDKLGKCEISWRYRRSEISWLERHNKIPNILDLNNIPV
ncbi:MAG: translation initiation factor 1A [Candidatus Lokiarchaeota archaeon]|nr:translation initiation factor 1A [Candidatus Lokiarchaeota archaeon]MBD3201771.1 translation initiation factor 1A [Candidatus Lokiarchaeota archaeon]